MKTPNLSKTYRLTWKTRFKMLFGLLFFIPALLILFVGFSSVVTVSFAYAISVGGVLQAVIHLFQCFIGAFLLFFCLVAVYVLIQPFVTYIRLSPQGIEFRKGLMHGLRSSWEGVESIGQYQSLTRLEVLYLKQFEPLRWTVYLPVQRKLGISHKKYFIQLTGFKGWPEGDLAEDLRGYAPHLFASQESERVEAV